MTKDEAMDLALVALEKSIALTMGNIDLRYKAITAIKQARALDKKADNARELGLDYEPHKGLSEHMAQATNGRVRIDPVTGDVGIGTAPVQPAPVQEPAGRTDQQIVDQTEELAVWLLSWCFGHRPETDTPMRESAHPFAGRCWNAACHIQEMLTATDPENSVAELDVDTTPPAAQRQFVGLDDDDISALGLSIAKARALESLLKRKNT